MRIYKKIPAVVALYHQYVLVWLDVMTTVECSVEYYKVPLTRGRLPAFSFPHGVSQVDTASGEKVVKSYNHTFSRHHCFHHIIKIIMIIIKGDIGLSRIENSNLHLCRRCNADKDLYC